MYQYDLECECGFTTSDINSFVPSGVKKYCKNCLEAREHIIVNNKEIGECKDCRNLEDLEWFYAEEDSPHHGSQTECETCGAEYYDHGDKITFENEQAKNNFKTIQYV